MTKIKDKIGEISRFLGEMEDIVPSSYDEYKSSIEKKAACERYVEKIVEAMTDLAFLIIKGKKFRLPEDDIDAFNILLENKIIGGVLAARLKSAKGMRNIIAHQYGEINDKLVFESITDELGNDAIEFVKIVEKM